MDNTIIYSVGVVVTFLGLIITFARLGMVDTDEDVIFATVISLIISATWFFFVPAFMVVYLLSRIVKLIVRLIT